MSLFPSIIALSTMAVVALVITVARGGINADSAALHSAARMAILAIVCQVLHFAEEVGGELNHRLPEYFGFDPIAMETFLGINVVALMVWALSVPALMARVSAALFPLWFLAVASVSNALLHPALAIAISGYFPGVLTSPLMGAAGLLLMRGLARITKQGGLAP